MKEEGDKIAAMVEKEGGAEKLRQDPEAMKRLIGASI